MTYVSVFNAPGNGRQDESSLYSLAIEFLEAAHQLRTNPPTKVNFRAVIYYLAGHSAELLLKAFLYRHNMDIPQLKRIGHDLEQLVAVVREHHLLDQASFSHIMKLAPSYNSKEFEYRRHVEMMFPDPDMLIDEVRHLAAEVFLTITQDNS